MKINAAEVIYQRMCKAWTQEQLAVASGLSQRTIQRVEQEATSSLETKKSIAAAFDIDLTQLDYKEANIVKQFQYKTIELPFKFRLFKSSTPDIEALLNAEGTEGWQLKQIVMPTTGFGESNSMLVILEREVML